MFYRFSMHGLFLVAELSTTRLKVKSIVLVRNFYNFAGLINNALMLNMVNPSAWGWGVEGWIL